MIEIRLATPADARAIAELSRREIEHGLPWRWTPPRVLSALRDRETNVAVALEPQGCVVGFGIMVYRDATAHLNLLAVDPATRRRGVGAKLLAWLERVAGVAGIERIELEARRSNAAALAFYARHGYVRTGTVAGYYLGVEDAVRLCKQLAQTSGASV